jgi:diguanylate cyclase (GGDEF)-like protein
MTSFVRNWVILCLLVFSVGWLLAHRLDAFKLELDLLDAANHYSLYAESSSNIEHTLITEGISPKLKCRVQHNAEENYCALTILLSEADGFTNLENGKDLSIYQTLDLDIDYSTPPGNPNIRVSFRNYNSDYTKFNDYTSLKYNTFAFEPQFNNSTSAIPLSTFSVEDWWLEKFKNSKSAMYNEFDNIAFIEIFPNEISEIYDYEITVNRMILRGETINEINLLIAILALWLLLIIALVYQNTVNLKKMAITDVLTGCINRRGLSLWIDKKLFNFYLRDSLCVFYVDIDDFKKINDIYGHNAGDQLLCEFTQIVHETITSYTSVGQSYRLCRLAGDEFVIALFDLTEEEIQPLAKHLISAVTVPIQLDTCVVKISTSIGINYTEKKPEKFQDLIDRADMAMYYAKKHGKNQYKRFDKTIANDLFYRQKLSEKIKLAFDKREFHLNFMPICDSKTLHITKVEVLLRTVSENLEGIGPDVYIPIAEEYNLIHDIDMWVIEKTLQTIKQNTQLLSNSPVVFCINISALELHHDQFVTKLEILLRRYEIAPDLVELEITETSLVDTNSRSIDTLMAIRKLGVGLALDDFGTGYTAFSQLTNYPVDCLKIDRSFIRDLDTQNEIQVTMLKAVLSIAKAYKLETIAEGIETQEQLDFLRDNACHLVQGYLLSKPIEFSNLVTLLKSKKPLDQNTTKPA